MSVKSFYERFTKDHGKFMEVHKLCYHPVIYEVLPMSDLDAKVNPC
jgi:hypothetical protein